MPAGCRGWRGGWEAASTRYPDRAARPAHTLRMAARTDPSDNRTRPEPDQMQPTAHQRLKRLDTAGSRRPPGPALRWVASLLLAAAAASAAAAPASLSLGQ